MEHKRVQFSSKTAFIFAAAASAVGLGNLWRFPRLAAQDGGMFLIVYILLALTFGFVLMITEVALGRKSRNTPIGAYESIDKKYSIIGKISVLIPAIIVPYYCVIGGWVVSYFLMYLLGTIDVTSSLFFDYAGFELGGIISNPAVTFFAFLAGVVTVIALGVKKGIEKLNLVFMPIFVVLMIAITVYFFFTIDHAAAVEGLKQFLIPTAASLEPGNFMKILADASSQLFYSLSLAMGIMITYGSYVDKKDNLEVTCRTISGIDTGVAILAGFMIVPAGLMVAGSGITGTSSVGFMFIGLPNVFDTIPSGDLVAAVFFFCVLIAALTSAISLGEALVASFMDHWKLTRQKAVIIFAGITAVVGLITCLGFGPLDHIVYLGKGILDWLDLVSNYILMPIVALALVIIIGHIVKTQYIIDEVEVEGHVFKGKNLYTFVIKWVAPIFLIIILCSGIWENLLSKLIGM